MSKAILVKTGGGGVTSDDVTVMSYQVLEGKTTVTADSADEIITGTALSDATVSNANQMLNGIVAYGRNAVKITGNIQSMNGSTITPSTSQQTVSCAGKKMNSNIVVNAIPSSYVNIGGSNWITF